MSTQYEDTCIITCSDNDKKMPAEILEFREGQVCTVTINRQVKVSLHYDEWTQKYIGRSAGLEFVTEGPKGHSTKKSLRG